LLPTIFLQFAQQCESDVAIPYDFLPVLAIETPFGSIFVPKDNDRRLVANYQMTHYWIVVFGRSLILVPVENCNANTGSTFWIEIRIFRLLNVREFKSASRERNIVAGSIIVPSPS
jgi:hypothetical protein